MSLGPINVAVDHADGTISQYLSAFDLSAALLSRVRTNLIDVVLQSGADSVVVRPSDYCRALAVLEPHRILLGMPDENSLGTAIARLGATLSSFDSSGATLKIGFVVNEGDLSAVKANVIQLRRLPGIAQFVVEPYFHDGLAIAQRGEWIAAAVECERICAFKLDVKNPERVLETYEKTAGVFPWYARSDGMSFPEFLQRLEIAKQVGCAGAIAGAAVWRSELPKLSSASTSEALECIVRRVDIVRAAFLSE